MPRLDILELLVFLKDEDETIVEEALRTIRLLKLQELLLVPRKQQTGRLVNHESKHSDPMGLALTSMCMGFCLRPRPPSRHPQRGFV